MVLMREGRAEQSHDAVTQHLINGSFIAMNRSHHHVQDRINELLSLFGIDSFEQSCRTLDVGKENRHLLPFSFQQVARSQYLFSKVFGKGGVGRLRCGPYAGRDTVGSVEGVTTISAKLRRPAIWLATVRTSGFQPHATLVTKSGIQKILGFASRANHSAIRSFAESSIFVKGLGTRWRD